MEHNCEFKLTPTGHRDSNNEMEDQKLCADDQTTPFNFDARKLFQKIRKPTEDECNNLPFIEITAPIPYEPKVETFVPNRKKIYKTLKKVPMEEWSKWLALVPEKVIKKNLEAAIQLALDLESDKRTMPKRHFKSRFSFFKCPRLRDKFDTDPFFPYIRSSQNRTCVQTLMGKDTGCW